jgi:hypothetical protein
MAGSGMLEAKLPVRRLTATLSRVSFLFLQQIDRRCRDGLVDVAAA